MRNVDVARRQPRNKKWLCRRLAAPQPRPQLRASIERTEKSPSLRVVRNDTKSMPQRVHLTRSAIPISFKPEMHHLNRPSPANCIVPRHSSLAIDSPRPLPMARYYSFSLSLPSLIPPRCSFVPRLSPLSLLEAGLPPSAAGPKIAFSCARSSICACCCSGGLRLLLCAAASQHPSQCAHSPSIKVGPCASATVRDGKDIASN